jgi:hypothetical protein
VGARADPERYPLSTGQARPPRPADRHRDPRDVAREHNVTDIKRARRMPHDAITERDTPARERSLRPLPLPTDRALGIAPPTLLVVSVQHPLRGRFLDPPGGDQRLRCR